MRPEQTFNAEADKAFEDYVHAAFGGAQVGRVGVQQLRYAFKAGWLRRTMPTEETSISAAVKICDDAAKRLARSADTERLNGNGDAARLRDAQSSLADQLGSQIRRLTCAQSPLARSPEEKP